MLLQTVGCSRHGVGPAMELSGGVGCGNNEGKWWAAAVVEELKLQVERIRSQQSGSLQSAEGEVAVGGGEGERGQLW